MKDLQAILAVCRTLDLLDSEVQPFALATVVKVEGSAYRRPGARMLVRRDGTRVGSISGGCLEADVVAHAQKVLQTGEPVVVLYDVRSSNGDIVVELGCKGAVTLLIEPLTAAVRDSLEFLTRFEEERGDGAMATVFRVAGPVSLKVGDRLMRREKEVPGGSLSSVSLPPLQPCLNVVQQQGQYQVRTFSLSENGGEAEVFIEPIRPPIALMLCGAGQDALPLAQMARLLGWQVTVLDHRVSLLKGERFPGVEALLPTDRRENVPLDTRTAAVVMTHSYTHDLQWLQFLLPSPIRYIGLLGPRKRAHELQQHLLEEGLSLAASDLQRLHSPTGLDLGAETSEEIALSILAEIQAVFQERPAGFLRFRQGPIHTTTAPDHESDFHSANPRAVCPASV